MYGVVNKVLRVLLLFSMMFEMKVVILVMKVVLKVLVFLNMGYIEMFFVSWLRFG